ncbi:MAG TPA: hypothetical protein EYP14_18545 [Planctomycetaceae bacterium]|nr:hypothetical protein [Planctomycetaceae bacterium]
MNIGNRNWWRYWAEETYKKYWTGLEPVGLGADGLFADNCGYRMPWRGQWHLEGHPEKSDTPVDYTRDGEHQADLYEQHIQTFHRWIVPWLAERHKRIVLNFGNMVRDPGSWSELDRQLPPVFAAMEEGAFVHPWGTLGRAGNFVFWPEREWFNQVRAMRRLGHVRALMNVHGPVLSQVEGLKRMDESDASGNRCWDVLWYALASFLMGYDDARKNAYMNFTVWGYSRFYWLDEFDAKDLHLGKALGQIRKVAGSEGYVYMREFEDGWVAANPSAQDAKEVPVPRGEARVLAHDTFKAFERVPLVETFDLASHRGVVLLKPGRHPGDADNRLQRRR